MVVASLLNQKILGIYMSSTFSVYLLARKGTYWAVQFRTGHLKPFSNQHWSNIDPANKRSLRNRAAASQERPSNNNNLWVLPPAPLTLAHREQIALQSRRPVSPLPFQQPNTLPCCCQRPFCSCCIRRKTLAQEWAAQGRTPQTLYYLSPSSGLQSKVCSCLQKFLECISPLILPREITPQSITHNCWNIFLKIYIQPFLFPLNLLLLGVHCRVRVFI